MLVLNQGKLHIFNIIYNNTNKYRIYDIFKTRIIKFVGNVVLQVKTKYRNILYTVDITDYFKYLIEATPGGRLRQALFSISRSVGNVQSNVGELLLPIEYYQMNKLLPTSQPNNSPSESEFGRNVNINIKVIYGIRCKFLIILNEL